MQARYWPPYRYSCLLKIPRNFYKGLTISTGRKVTFKLNKKAKPTRKVFTQAGCSGGNVWKRHCHCHQAATLWKLPQQTNLFGKIKSYLTITKQSQDLKNNQPVWHWHLHQWLGWNGNLLCVPWHCTLSHSTLCHDNVFLCHDIALLAMASHFVPWCCTCAMVLCFCATILCVMLWHCMLCHGIVLWTKMLPIMPWHGTFWCYGQQHHWANSAATSVACQTVALWFASIAFQHAGGGTLHPSAVTFLLQEWKKEESFHCWKVE